MLQRRIMMSGLIAAPAIIPFGSLMVLSRRPTPMPRLAAIVRPGSLMPISKRPEIVAYVVRVRQRNGAESRIVGEGTVQDVQDVPSLIRHLSDKLLWSPFNDESEISISLLRGNESARDLGLI
jgi:hypothetical protein